MQGSGRHGPHRHGEQARVAERVRALLGGGPEASPATPTPQGLPGPPDPPDTGLRLWLRWEPDRRAVTAIAVAVLVAGLLTAWWVFSSRPRRLAVQSASAEQTSQVSATLSAGAIPSMPSVPGGGSGTTGATSASAVPLVVDVAGKVRHPGVYRLAPGSRVIDAVRAAGGVKSGVSTTSLNLAAPVQDGEQVLVGVRGAPAPVGGVSTNGSATGPVDLNSATLGQLEALPGIGPVLAQHILDWRTQHGSFTSVSQLDEVSGIGPAKFAALRDQVTV